MTNRKEIRALCRYESPPFSACRPPKSVMLFIEHVVRPDSPIYFFLNMPPTQLLNIRSSCEPPNPATSILNKHWQEKEKWEEEVYRSFDSATGDLLEFERRGDSDRDSVPKMAMGEG